MVAKIASPAGTRQVTGSMDLLLEAKDVWIVVDHKTYPGADLDAKARAHAPQLAAYAHLLRSANGPTQVQRFVHFPIAATLAELLEAP